MRTKTMLLSALLGTLGSVSLMAQSTNVYSLNAVGYINVTIPAGGASGAFSIVSCPLQVTPDNTLNTLFVDTNGAWAKYKMYFYDPVAGGYTAVSALPHAWASTTATLAPGQAAFMFTPANSNATTVTFVGTVPTGTFTNPILPGFNLISSVLPTDGDMVTNPLMDFTTGVKGDIVYTFSPSTQTYTSYKYPNTHWIPDPQQTTVGGGIFYFSAGAAGTTNDWVENFSVGQ